MRNTVKKTNSQQQEVVGAQVSNDLKVQGIPNFTDKQPSDRMELIAIQLKKVLDRHNPVIIRDKAFSLMLKAQPETDEFRVYAAAFEIMDIFK